ncbi:MAG: pyruvate kinase [Cytophagales bacterium]
MSTFVKKRTKVIATVGPSCNTEEKLWELVQAGVDIFRLNFSHGSHEVHKQVIEHVRNLNKKHGTSICLLQDLQGPKIRTGEIENNGVDLVVGSKIIITTEKIIGNAEKISTSYKLMPRDVKAGDAILIDDGKLELKVEKVEGQEIICEVKYGGILKSKKGINLPNTAVSEPSLTEKDREDLMFGLENDVEWIALSFVRSPEDLIDIKRIIKSKGKASKVIAKIEKPEALANIDAIIEESDALMIARGDLGVEIDFEDVPVAQKMMIRKCNIAAKPVIVATQMMESMITSPRPTRAEVNDVANAVMDGADTVMLSAETASGMYPIETVNAMVRIIKGVEENADIFNKFFEIDPASPTHHNESVIDAAVKLAISSHAKAIIGTSKSGFTAFKTSSHRPEADIFIFTDNKKLETTLNLIWGVKAFYFDKFSTTDQAIHDINQFLVEKGLLKKGDVVVNTGSMPIDETNPTNMIKLSVIK